MLKPNMRSGLVSSSAGRYSTPRRLRNIPSDATRLMLVLTPHNVATLRRSNTFGHSWGCTAKSFSKGRNRNIGIEDSYLSHSSGVCGLGVHRPLYGHRSCGSNGNTCQCGGNCVLSPVSGLSLDHIDTL